MVENNKNPIALKCQDILTILEDVRKLREQRDAKGKLMEITRLLATDFEKIESLNSEIFNIINPKIIKPAEIKEVVQKPVKIDVPKPVIPVPNYNNTEIKKENIEEKKQAPVASKEVKTFILSPELASQKFKKLTDKEKDRYMQDLAITYEHLYDYLEFEKKKGKGTRKDIKKEDYTIYVPKEEAVMANKYAKKYADKLLKKYPGLFKPLFKQYAKVNMNYLSRSWVSMMLFFSVLAMPGSLILLFMLKLIFTGVFEIGFGVIIAAMFILPVLTFIGLYLYPGSLIADRDKKIKNELPFALIHMSSVAGSGAHPISIFELLTESDEYPELKTEIRKILNYVNLFGYNLSTALKNTAATTPSQDLKELLNGMVSSIETGGDLKEYLKGKAESALVTYRIERKKEVDALGTFSEIYTTILIAAPLLLVVTLAIMNSITSTLAGMNIITLAYLGVGIGLPLLNIGFIIFLESQVSNM